MAKLEINREICKSCGLCIRFCPQKVLKIGSYINKKGFAAVEADADKKCVGCAICATMCPECAIEVYR